MGILANLLGGGIVNSLEKVALEFITTDMESAQAKVLKIKALDPNGKMRRDLSRFASRAYGFFLFTTALLVFMHAFGIGEAASSKEAIDAMTKLFLPITTSWGAIVTASFGVNTMNTYKGEKK
jgi:hypothetical protein